ncbi:MAG: UDP-N-acetylmuramoyl-L-alanyl-D-glutamate--2,6-diaminopimelate ligase, partial [Gloeobacteraceae cyanobacterium ES-bin-316]|nr:UDP-N-acetylmuramoyl-L-alanyl-D-glutamate--2,6-diaminopimelate ligase [Ferruginibacter sp.]
MLQELLYKLAIRSVKGDTNITIGSLHTDSRSVKSGGCFIAVKGTATDGHSYIDQAIQNGAVAIVCQQLPSAFKDQVTYVQVDNSAIAAGMIAHKFYGEPSNSFKLVGVTGTNGKTTIATLLFKLFTSLGYQCGLVSTVQIQVGENIIPATHTTPDAITLNHLLQQMKEA